MDPSDYLRSLHMHANKLLDHRIPQTGMTFSEMGSKLIVVSMNQSEKGTVITANYILNSQRKETVQRYIQHASWPWGIPGKEGNIVCA